MVNEEILTALKNSVDKGEDLMTAVNLLINSGYNPREVQEASNFVSGGIIRNLEPKPDEHLVMPNERNMFYRTHYPDQFNQPTRNEFSQIKQEISRETPRETPRDMQYQRQLYMPPQYQQPQYPQPPPLSSEFQPVPSTGYQRYTSPPEPLANQLKQMAPPKESYTVEIILLIILLVLIGFLIATILFKDKFLDIFSQFTQ